MVKRPGDSTITVKINTQPVCMSSPSNALFRRSAIPEHLGRIVGQIVLGIITLEDFSIDWPTELDKPAASAIITGSLNVQAVSRGWGGQTGKAEHGDQGG